MISETSYAGLVSRLKVVIVGGGIIGLTTAFRAAQSGYEVTLLDPLVAKGATWAAAGMLAPIAEISPGEEDNYRLQLEALAGWRQLDDELHSVIHRRLALTESGTLLVGWDASDRRLVDQFKTVAQSFGAPVLPIQRSTHSEAFSGVTARITDGLLLAGDAWLDPDQAVEHLIEALGRLPVTIIGEQVEKIGNDTSGIWAETSTNRYLGDRGICATGWHELPKGVQPIEDHQVRPVRGVTVRVQGPDRSGQPMIRAFIRGRSFYMVSRPGGYCVIGASADEKPDLLIEVGELQRLLRDALDLLPELENAALLETRSGVRPASANLLPFFGELSVPGWAWSSGHYRHGVTLAPSAANRALDYLKGAT